jgi:hypothetical protein
MQNKLTWLSIHVLHGKSVRPNKSRGETWWDSASYLYPFTCSYITGLVVSLHKLHSALPLDLLHTAPV